MVALLLYLFGILVWMKRWTMWIGCIGLYHTLLGNEHPFRLKGENFPFLVMKCLKLSVSLILFLVKQNLMHWKQTWEMKLKLMESPPTSNLIKNLIWRQSLTYLQLHQDKQQHHMAEPMPRYNFLPHLFLSKWQFCSLAI